MWKRFAEYLRCPLTRSPLRVVPFEQRRIDVAKEHAASAGAAEIPVDDGFTTWVDTGVLVAGASTMYPILGGLPVLLPYRTGAHDELEQRFGAELAKLAPAAFASETPMIGELHVQRSFSEEWREYQYDGVLWDVSYSDNKARLKAEVGLSTEQFRGRTWLEVGCGIGMTTAQAQAMSGTDAVGVDLGFAVVKATRQFSSNPFLHYVQASVFKLPFAPQVFDIVYSRGVLHHTCSTRNAFMAMALAAKSGGRTYLWVYGPGSMTASPLRFGAFVAEAVLRPMLSRASTPVATAALVPIAAGYLGFNAFRRWQHGDIQPYTFERALHAARDRFTPRFAYRQSASEVSRWFTEAGFEGIEVVDAAQIPIADRGDYGRNTGVRGVRR